MLSVCPILNEPRARIVTRPICTPPVFRWSGTTARTKSPVLNPCTSLNRLGLVRGRPCLSRAHTCREPRPMALVPKTCMSGSRNTSAPDSPPHAASIQWALGYPCRFRLNFIRAAVPTSTGKPVASDRSGLYSVAWPPSATISPYCLLVFQVLKASTRWGFSSSITLTCSSVTPAFVCSFGRNTRGM